MNINASGCYCNEGWCIACFQAFVSCNSLKGYCQFGHTIYPFVNTSDSSGSCPYSKPNGPCGKWNGYPCDTECPLWGPSGNGGWYLGCQNDLTVPSQVEPMAICSL